MFDFAINACLKWGKMLHVFNDVNIGLFVANVLRMMTVVDYVWKKGLANVTKPYVLPTTVIDIDVRN